MLYLFIYGCAGSPPPCEGPPPSRGKRGPLFITVRGPLTIAAPPVAEHRLQTRRLSNCGSRAHLLRGMWDLPRPGLEPMSPALAGRLSTTVPPGKPDTVNLIIDLFFPSFYSEPESQTGGSLSAIIQHTWHALCILLALGHFLFSFLGFFITCFCIYLSFFFGQMFS